MFLKIASWRAPGSILEAPGLDFRGSEVDFFEIVTFQHPKMIGGFIRILLQWIRIPKHDRRIFHAIPSNRFTTIALRTCRELAEVLPRSCPATGRLPSIAKLLWPRYVGPRSFKGEWGGGGPPLGGLQLNAPHPVMDVEGV